MPRISFDIREDEQLTIEVRKYPCLFDKSDPGYKEKDRVDNAWREIDAYLGVEEGEAKRRFENLKKRYSKKRATYKKTARSGSGSWDVKVAEQEIKKYDFLSWLAPFLRLKENTSSNVPTPNIQENDIVASDNEDNKDDAYLSDDCSEKSVMSSVISDKEVVSNKEVAVSNANSVAGPSSEKHWARYKRKQPAEMQRKELELMGNISKSLSHTESPTVVKQDSDELFGMMVTAEIQTLSPQKKRRVKNEINNLIFKYQEEDEMSSSIHHSTSQTYHNTNRNLTENSLENRAWYQSLGSYMTSTSSNN